MAAIDHDFISRFLIPYSEISKSTHETSSTLNSPSLSPLFIWINFNCFYICIRFQLYISLSWCLPYQTFFSTGLSGTSSWLTYAPFRPLGFERFMWLITSISLCLVANILLWFVASKLILNWLVRIAFSVWRLHAFYFAQELWVEARARYIWFGLLLFTVKWLGFLGQGLRTLMRFGHRSNIRISWA